MNKKIKIISSLIFLLLIGLLFGIVWQKNQNSKTIQPEYAFFEDFIKQEIDGQIFYKNSKAEIKFKIPFEWTAIKSQIASIALISSDFVDFKETDQIKAFIPKTGCWIGISVKNCQSDDSDYAITKDRLDHQDLISELNRSGDFYEIFNLNGKAMIRREFLINNIDNIGKNISLKLAEKNKVYLIETYLFGEKKEECQQFFDEFLNTVEIK